MSENDSVQGARGRVVGLLDRRVWLRTPHDGLGITSDAVYLAAASPVRAGMRVLDAGCGVGAAAICLAARIRGLELHGLEIDGELAALARQNGVDNGVGEWTVRTGDLFAPPPSAYGDGFDCVLTNPPWQRSDGSTPSPDRRRMLALREGEVGRRLSDWLFVCARLVCADGVLVAILPFHRVEEGLADLDGWSAEIRPLHARAGRAPSKALLRLRRSDSPSRRLLPALYLHEGDRPSPEAVRILRSGAEIPWRRSSSTCARGRDSSISAGTPMEDPPNANH